MYDASISFDFLSKVFVHTKDRAGKILEYGSSNSKNPGWIYYALQSIDASCRTGGETN
jgi:hypothetical protein